MATTRLTSGQKSAMQSLAKNNGFSTMSGAMYRTYTSLHEKGLVTVTIETPVRGYVTMTDEGRKMFPLRENFCHQCDQPTHPDEAACIECGEAKSWVR